MIYNKYKTSVYGFESHETQIRSHVCSHAMLNRLPDVREDSNPSHLYLTDENDDIANNWVIDCSIA